MMMTLHGTKKHDPVHHRRSRRLLLGSAYIGLYLGLAVAPLLVLSLDELPPRRDFWTELSVALGFLGLSTMALQFAVTARLRHVAAPYGIDVVVQFHRQIAVVATLMVVAHPVILFVRDPELLALLNVLEAPWRARFGVTGLVALLALVVSSVWRGGLRLPYEPWRIAHGVLAVVAVAFSLTHIELVGHYLNEPWKRGFWAVLTTVLVALLAYVRVVKPLRLRRRPWRVAAVRRETEDTTTLALEPDGHEGLRFLPGQFAWLILGDSPFTVEQHPFSISSSAMKPERPELTIKALGDWTGRVSETPIGRRAYLEGPYGAFSVDRYPAPGYVFVAGGVGITPFVGMLRTLEDRGDTRHHRVIYASGRATSLIFKDELDRLAAGPLDLGVTYVLGDPPAGWDGATGRIDADLLRRQAVDELPGHVYFVCGPDPMMDAVEDALLELGVPLDSIHSERFALD
ncbi:MAG TPA: ferric reductase-like transmembrane domain-containing protein [Thermoleophilia bacterium]|nr:ferric reductase-like transmembrane domain-containing protein [Thermoleophilia bacterium]